MTRKAIVAVIGGICLLLGMTAPGISVYASGSRTTLTIEVPEIPADEIQVPESAETPGDIELPEGWTWLEEDARLIPGGITELTAVYKNEEGEILREKVISVSCGVRIIEEWTDASYTAGQGTPFVLVCNGAAEEFQYLEIDGRRVPESRYRVENGSTILSLRPEYMDQLSAGVHTAEMFYTVGSACWEFRVTAKTAAGETTGNSRPAGENTESGKNTTQATATSAAKTADDSPLLLSAAGMLLALAAASGCVVMLRRKEERQGNRRQS